MFFAGRIIGTLVGLLEGWIGAIIGFFIGYVIDELIFERKLFPRKILDFKKVNLNKNQSDILINLIDLMADLEHPLPVEKRSYLISIFGSNLKESETKKTVSKTEYFELFKEFAGQLKISLDDSEKKLFFDLVKLLLISEYSGGSKTQLLFFEYLQKLFELKNTTLVQSAGLQDSYRVLGLETGCGAAKVKQIYRQLAAQFHPDTLLDLERKQQLLSAEAFIKIQESYNLVLANEELNREDRSS